MSVVSSVVLQISCVEDIGNDDACLVPPINAINKWLAENGFGELVAVEDHFGGNKHPQTLVYGAGYNGLLEDEFAAVTLEQDWAAPENMVLLINPEEGGTKVYRANDAASAQPTSAVME